MNKIFEINPEESPFSNLPRSDVKINTSFLDDELRPVTENEQQLTAIFVRIIDRQSAQHSAHLTALRRGLAVSILFNVVLLAAVLFTIGR